MDYNSWLRFLFCALRFLIQTNYNGMRKSYIMINAEMLYHRKPIYFEMSRRRRMYKEKIFQSRNWIEHTTKSYSQELIKSYSIWFCFSTCYFQSMNKQFLKHFRIVECLYFHFREIEITFNFPIEFIFFPPFFFKSAFNQIEKKYLPFIN